MRETRSFSLEDKISVSPGGAKHTPIPVPPGEILDTSDAHHDTTIQPKASTLPQSLSRDCPVLCSETWGNSAFAITFYVHSRTLLVDPSPIPFAIAFTQLNAAT